MRTLLLWTAVAVMTAGTAGCCRTWSLCRRAAPCDGYAVYDAAPICESECVPPMSTAPILPGPAVEVPAGP